MARPHLFRARDPHDHSPVTYIELFFDLVFVFAITQLSHRLLDHLTLFGALETLVLFLAIWWVWIYTSWTTNWLDPERGNVRLMLIAMMTGGLVLSSAIPEAYGSTGLMFALAYVAMQLFRTLYMVWASTGVHEGRRRNFLRISFWFLVSAVAAVVDCGRFCRTVIAFSAVGRRIARRICRAVRLLPHALAGRFNGRGLGHIWWPYG